MYLGATSPGRAGATGTNDGGSVDTFLTSLAASEALACRLASACGYASSDAMVAAMRPSLLESLDPASSTHVLLVSCTFQTRTVFAKQITDEHRVVQVAMAAQTHIVFAKLVIAARCMHAESPQRMGV